MIVRKQTIRFSPDRTPMPKKVKIGYESDNMVERLVFVLPDISESQTATMMMDGEYANMVTLEQSGEDDRYFADMTAERVGAAGEIECYIVIDGENGEVWNSGTFYLATGEVPAVNEELAERYPDAIEQMRTEMAEHRVEMAEQVQRAEDAADRADGAADGKEGGYYIPAVDGDMLKWTPSKENMPEIPAANVRGPQGSDGAPGRDGADGQDGKPGADGVSPRVSVEDIDGGHRVTFVDAEGMKTIDVLDGEKGADGAQGPAGNPGVHVGGDEPEGPDVRLWIDPEGEDYPAVSYQPQTLTEEQQTQARDNIGAASAEAVGKLSEDKADRSEIPEPYVLPTASADTLGGVKVGEGLQMDGDVLGVVPEPEMVLIERFTVDEEVNEIDRYREPDGTLYNFSTVTIRAKFPPSTKTGNLSIYFSFKWPAEIRNYMINPYNATAERNGYSKCYLSNNRWRGGWWTCVLGAGDFAQYYENPVNQEQYGIEDGYVNKIRFYHVVGIETGTEIEIWGVRA